MVTWDDIDGMRVFRDRDSGTFYIYRDNPKTPRQSAWKCLALINERGRYEWARCPEGSQRASMLPMVVYDEVLAWALKH